MFRLGVRLWLAAMTGVVAMTLLVLPALLATIPEITGQPAPPVPLWLLCAASLLQSGVLVALAVWAGCALAPKVGLAAPWFAAPSLAALRGQVLPAIPVGVGSGALLIAFLTIAPEQLRSAQARLNAPILARVLYGGLTEEVLLRWGVMTLLVWILWRVVQKRGGAPRAALVWTANVTSALAFGAGHLPAATLLAGRLTPESIVWVILANALFGIAAGWLYWRRGLEAAMIAHALAHVVAWAARG
jgi:hypothetical protein